MHYLICVTALGMIAAGALFEKEVPAKVEKTMSVNRCQAILKNGSQCERMAAEGKSFCWQHRASEAVNRTMTDAGEGGKRTWESTKTWSTNVWESTKSGWNKAVDATKDSFDGVRVGMVELLGGKDVKREKEDKE